MSRAGDELFPNVAGKLLWFFSRGAISLERSTAGGMLERAKNMHVTPSQVTWPKVVDGEIRYSEHELTARITAEFRNEAGH